MSYRSNIENVRNRIEAAAYACGRDPRQVRLVAVSKRWPADIVRQGIAAGITDLGENYIQEAKEKIAALADCNVCWHFIGHLQSNKAKFAIPLFEYIHSVDSVKLAREINRHAARAGKVQKILVQVNTGREATKSGVLPEELQGLIEEIACFENLSVRGLMTIPPVCNTPDDARPYFRELARLRDSIIECSIPNVCMDELSMGMSSDFEVAIEEGATMVRIGTAIFGERP